MVVLRRLAWVLTVPLGLIAVSFAATNRQLVEVGLWPLPFQGGVPVYLLVLGAFVLGFVVGGSLIWLRVAPRLWKARKDARQVVKLEKTLSNQVKADMVARTQATALPPGEAQRHLPAA